MPPVTARLVVATLKRARNARRYLVCRSLRDPPDRPYCFEVTLKFLFVVETESEPGVRGLGSSYHASGFTTFHDSHQVDTISQRENSGGIGFWADSGSDPGVNYIFKLSALVI